MLPVVEDSHSLATERIEGCRDHLFSYERFSSRPIVPHTGSVGQCGSNVS